MLDPDYRVVEGTMKIVCVQSHLDLGDSLFACYAQIVSHSGDEIINTG